MSKKTEKKRTNMGCSQPKEMPKYDYQAIAYASGGISLSQINDSEPKERVIWPENFAL